MWRVMCVHGEGDGSKHSCDVCLCLSVFVCARVFCVNHDSLVPRALPSTMFVCIRVFCVNHECVCVYTCLLREP